MNPELNLFGALCKNPVLGDPGSGKSTVVNWLCTALVHGVKSPLAHQLGGPFVPVPMVLRELGLGGNFTELPDAGKRWSRLLELFLERPVAAQLAAEWERHTRLAPPRR